MTSILVNFNNPSMLAPISFQSEPSTHGIGYMHDEIVNASVAVAFHLFTINSLKPIYRLL